MPVDSVSKRRSVMTLGTPFVAALPEPDGGISAPDRLHLAYLYSGIAAGVVTVEESLTDIRDGLKTRLETITGLRVYSSQVDNIQQFPCAVLILDRLDYVITVDGFTFEGTWRVLVLVDAAVRQDAYELMDDYLDPAGTRSIEAAVYGDSTFGGFVDGVVVRRASGIGPVPELGATLIGATFNIDFLRKVTR
jgi:hypothetical protein